MGKIPLYDYFPVYLSIPLLMDTWTCQFLASMNKLLWTFLKKDFCGHLFSFLLGEYLTINGS